MTYHGTHKHQHRQTDQELNHVRNEVIIFRYYLFTMKAIVAISKGSPVHVLYLQRHHYGPMEFLLQYYYSCSFKKDSIRSRFVLLDSEWYDYTFCLCCYEYYHRL